MNVLLIEDDESFAFSLTEYLQGQGHILTVVKEGFVGVHEAAKGYGCILLDLGLPDVDGMQLIPKLKEGTPRSHIIVLTGRDDISAAVGSMKAGAYDYITKPVDLEELSLILQRVAEVISLHDKLSYLDTKDVFALIGKTKPIEEIREMIKRISPHTTPVLIVGETGSGKEVVARLIHKVSGRTGNFVDINCSAIPRDLFEGELFGFKAGSFTGASKGKKGLAQWADKGTLFLDEIGDLPLELQPKLLRVLEQGEVRALGEGKNIKVDVRILAATNSDPDDMIKEGRLRQDLYYRLSTFLIRTPPLRERQEDILILAEYFLDEFSHKMKRSIKGFSEEVQNDLLNYDWPGNVRELKNIVERGVIMCDGKEMQKQHLPLSFFSPREKVLSLQEVEKGHIEKSLQHFDGNISRTAKALKIPRSTLRDKLKDMNIKHRS